MTPFLSIVTPTLGNFSEDWINRLLTIKGNVEFILVYPPSAPCPTFSDPRVKILWSSYKGETAQRFLGLMNARGNYLIALDDDDFLHPDVLALTEQYFTRFPESWVLRLSKIDVNYDDLENLNKEWSAIPNIEECRIEKRRPKATDMILQEVPIAPLDNAFRWSMVFNPYQKRKDHHGPHIENFNNKVWRTSLVKETLADLSVAMRFQNLLTWLPLWGFDRMLGLYLQAKFYQKGITIGHWMPSPEQVRYVWKPTSLKTIRLIFPNDAVLAKRFPQYGYFWNLFMEEFYNGVKTKIKYLGVKKNNR